MSRSSRAHDLGTSRLGKIGREDHFVRAGYRPDLVHDVFTKLHPFFLGGSHTSL